MPAKTKKGDKGKVESKTFIACGVYIFPNGDKYEGDYLQSTDGALERSGHGTHTTAEGTCYEGQWVNDKMTGEGVVQFPSGSMYEGEFVNNQFHGKGRYTWPNGAVYEGLFNENKMEGEAGEFTDMEKQVWVGSFRYKAAPGLKFKLAM